MPQIQTVIKDSVVERTVIKYHSDTVTIPGDTIVFEKAIPCPDAVVDTVIKKGHTTLSAKLFNGRLQVICKADSLLHIIDSLQEVSHFREDWHQKETIIFQDKEVVKNKVPKWCWYLLLIVSIYIGGKLLIWKYKLPVKI